MDNLHQNHQPGGHWPPVDYSINRNSVTIPNFDASGSIILNVGPSQTMQLVPPAANTSSASQMLHQQTSVVHQVTHNNPHHHHHHHHQQPPQQQQQVHNTHTVQGIPHTMLASNPVGHTTTTTQLQVGQILPSIVQSDAAVVPSMLMSNQHMTHNMLWQNVAPHTLPTLATASQVNPHLHQSPSNLVTVGVQTAVVGNNILGQGKSVHSHSQLRVKLKTKKRLNKATNEEQNVPNKKKSKLLDDKKKTCSQVSDGTKNEGNKMKKHAEKSELKRKRACNPQSWKKNIRKLMRVQGKGYVNTKGVYVPPKTRSGPPCNCRMRCYDSIPEQECNEIFDRFFMIGDKNIQDALLYSLITKEEPKHRRTISNKTDVSGEEKQQENNTTKHNIRNATFFYHVQCKEGIVRVCSAAFMSIYGATQKRVRRLQMHKFVDPLNPPKDLRGKHGNQKIIGMMKTKERREKESSGTTGVTINLANNLEEKTSKRPNNAHHKNEMTRDNQRATSNIEKGIHQQNANGGNLVHNVSNISSQPQPQQLTAQPHSTPLDYSSWHTIQHESQSQVSHQCLPSHTQQQQEQHHHPHHQLPPALQQSQHHIPEPQHNSQPLPVEMHALDSSGFLSGFLLGAAGEDFKSAVAKFNASSVSCGGALSNSNIQRIDDGNYSRDIREAAPTTSEKSKKKSGGNSSSIARLPDSIESVLSDTGTKLVKERSTSDQCCEDKQSKKRSRHPELWKKNIRKNNRAHGMAYVNSKGKLIPAKTRAGPPCKCRMRCYLRVTEEECNTIFRDFHKIGDKNVQDAVLYNLMIHKEVKHKKNNKKAVNVVGNSEENDEPQPQSQHSDLLDFIFTEGSNVNHDMQENFVRNLVNTSNFSADSENHSHQNTSEVTTTKVQKINKLSDGNLNSILNLSTSPQNHQQVVAENVCDPDTDVKSQTDPCASDTAKSIKSPRDRQATFWYYVQQTTGLIRVCSHAFMSIYGATQKRLRRLQQHKVANPIFPPKDMRGKHTAGTVKPRSRSKSSASKNMAKVGQKKGSVQTVSHVPHEPQALYVSNSGSHPIVLQGSNDMWQNTIL